MKSASRRERGGAAEVDGGGEVTTEEAIGGSVRGPAAGRARDQRRLFAAVATQRQESRRTRRWPRRPTSTAPVAASVDVALRPGSPRLRPRDSDRSPVA